MQDRFDIRSEGEGKIDIVVGGQYGDEGKGEIVFWLLQKRRKYDLSVRVGGSNAEHRFHAKPADSTAHTVRVLPVAVVDPECRLLLGAGHLFSVEQLQAEIKEFAQMFLGGEKSLLSRLLIDKNAGIVTEQHQKQSKEADRSKRGGTTGRGVGKAATHKVLRDGTFITAGMCKAIKSRYQMGSGASAIREILDKKKDILLEGSQGALLSLNHGYYPYCCAKDVTPTGILAEAGADVFSVRDIYAIYRSFPMRVPGKSGPTGGRELSWKEMEDHLEHSLSEEVKRQTLPDGTKGNLERIFEWSWDDFRKSLILCTPTKIILTFADWHRLQNYKQRSFEDLHRDTKILVKEMETEATRILGRHIPVVLIRTGPLLEDFVERE